MVIPAGAQPEFCFGRSWTKKQAFKNVKDYNPFTYILTYHKTPENDNQVIHYKEKINLLLLYIYISEVDINIKMYVQPLIVSADIVSNKFFNLSNVENVLSVEDVDDERVFIDKIA